MPSDTVIALRKQLREKFPSAHMREEEPPCPPSSDRREAPQTPSSNLDAESPALVALAESSPAPAHRSLGEVGFDALTGFPTGAITEISPGHPSCGLSLVIATLLSEGTETRKHRNTETLALIDCRDRFDPASFTPEECSRLLWLRCRDTSQALRSADLLLRDGNLPLVLLDLSSLPTRELRRIPNSSWHRLRQLAESTDTTLLALTPTPLIPRTSLRLTLTRQLTLTDLHLSREELLTTLQTQTTRRLHQTA